MPHHPYVNLLAVVVAALAAWILGALWYSPLLFAKAWVKAHAKQTSVEDVVVWNNRERDRRLSDLSPKSQAFMEGNPDLCTAYALLALSYCRPARK